MKKSLPRIWPFVPPHGDEWKLSSKQTDAYVNLKTTGLFCVGKFVILFGIVKTEKKEKK